LTMATLPPARHTHEWASFATAWGSWSRPAVAPASRAFGYFRAVNTCVPIASGWSPLEGMHPPSPHYNEAPRSLRRWATQCGTR